MAGFSSRELNALFSEAKVQFAREIHRELLEVIEREVEYELANVAGSLLIQDYATSAKQMFAAALTDAMGQIPKAAKANLIRAAEAVERSTIGETSAQQRDNEEIEALMESLAQSINDAILSEYIERFGDGSYREGDPSRRSGALEAFLRRDLIAQAEGHELLISLAPAANNADVPHLFRLNYGTQSLKGSPKPGTPPPEFRVQLVPGAPTHVRDMSAPRRPGFMYPGAGFARGFGIQIGGGGQVQLNNRQGKTVAFGRPGAMYPSRGIGPSYFVEYGVSRGIRTLPEEFRPLVDRWRKRIIRLSA